MQSPQSMRLSKKDVIMDLFQNLLPLIRVGDIASRGKDERIGVRYDKLEFMRLTHILLRQPNIEIPAL